MRTANFADRLLRRCRLLDANSPRRVDLRSLAGIATFHLLAPLACVPWLFSWSGLALGVAGLYVFGALGLNVGFHRLLAHRGFACPRWLEQALAVLGVCCWEGPPMGWVAVHRMRPGRHPGRFVLYDPANYSLTAYDRYARDLFQDRYYKWLERPQVWRRVHYAHWLVYPLLAALVGLFTGGASQLALSWLVWGVVVRTVAVWHGGRLNLGVSYLTVALLARVGLAWHPVEERRAAA